VGALQSKYTYAEMSSAINEEMTMNRNANAVENASLKSLVALKVAALVAVAVLSGCATTGSLGTGEVSTDVAEDFYRGA
jgi:hypothetical protein